MISHEDKKDVARVLGAKTANKAVKASDDSYFNKQQARFMGERKAAARASGGKTYMGRPIHELNREQGIETKAKSKALQKSKGAWHPIGAGRVGDKYKGGTIKEMDHKNARARVIPEVSKREEGKVLRSIDKKGFYASPAAQKALKKADRDYSSYKKERDSRYKREGLE